MLAWIRSPRGSTTTATAVAAILALFWLAPWSRPLPRLPFSASPVSTGQPAAAPSAQPQASTDVPAPAPAQGSATAPLKPTPDVASAPAAGPPPKTDVASLPAAKLPPAADLPPAESVRPTGTAAAPPAGGAPAADAAAPPGPSFDIVRVQPHGETVVAGRGAPGSEVVLMDGDTAVGSVKVDESGQFALLPPNLAPGSHYLTLQVKKEGAAPLRSSQSVAVTVAGDGAVKPLVALLAPDRPTQILSDGSAVVASPVKASAPAAQKPITAASLEAPPPGIAPLSAPIPVAIQAVEAQQGGRFMASGVARAGNQCRVYLNGAYLADVTAGKDGRWSVEVRKGMQPGRYTVRADEIEPASGKVINRAEVPFDYPVAMARGAAQRLLMGGGVGQSGKPVAGVAESVAVAEADDVSSPRGDRAAAAPAAKPAGRRLASAVSTSEPSSTAAAVIPDLHTTKVIRGDSLWRISRKMLGHGIQYTEIYASNTSQIRDPKLIYPGQVFVVPNKKPD